MTMADASLTTALKQAKSKKMFFAFVPKGADGKLIVSKGKIPPKQVAEAKKEVGGGTAITGKCFGEGNTMIFQVLKAAPSSMGAALKKVIHRDAGLTLIPEIQLAGDADNDEEETDEADNDEKETGDADNDEEETDEADSAEANDDADAAPTAPKAGAADTVDLGPWQTARQGAITNLKALAGKIAATKHASAVGVLKEIQALISKLPASPTPNDLGKLEDFLRNDDTITAAEEVPGHFHNLAIRAPLLEALASLKQ